MGRRGTRFGRDPQGMVERRPTLGILARTVARGYIGRRT